MCEREREGERAKRIGKLLTSQADKLTPRIPWDLGMYFRVHVPIFSPDRTTKLVEKFFFKIFQRLGYNEDDLYRVSVLIANEYGWSRHNWYIFYNTIGICILYPIITTDCDVSRH